MLVAKPPEQVRPADVLAFVTAQRTGRGGEHDVLQPVGPGGEPSGVSAATVRRRLSIVSGFFAFLLARGDVVANPVPRGLPSRAAMDGCSPAGTSLLGWLTSRSTTPQPRASTTRRPRPDVTGLTVTDCSSLPAT
jgi:hypothetical protein